MRESAPMIEPDTEPRPVTLLFHPICAEPTWICDWFQYSQLAPQWQICPRAQNHCEGNNYNWTAPAADTRRLVELAVATLKERHGDRVRDDSVVLAGFSQGAYAVAALVHELALHPGSPLHIKGIVAHGAFVHFAAAEVARLGPRVRVALTAGELDGAAHAMQEEAEKLRRAGVDARWFSLGKVDHFIPVNTATPLAEQIDWARAE
jgi:predicted esterase